MKKVAVYSGTRNVYPQMYTALKSLLVHNRMDRVYMMIEDDQFPFPVPENVIRINVSGQKYFGPDCANRNSPYSYMDLLRCVLASIFMQEKRMLWLDIDTIMIDDITELLETNMDGYFYAAAVEPGKCHGIFTYFNTGVTMCNLEMLRKHRKEIEMIEELNRKYYRWPAQDVINLLCQGRIREIGSEFNKNDYVKPCGQPKIVHFAAVTNYTDNEMYRKYERMKLED